MKKKRKTLRDLDHINTTELNERKNILQRYFKKRVFFALLFHIFILIATLTYIYFLLESTFIRVVFISVLNVFRIFLLIYILMKREILIVYIYGVDNYYKILRHVSFYPSLGLWLLIGFIDFYIIRLKIPIIDFLYFFLWRRNDWRIFLIYLSLDLFYIFDFYFTLHIVYYKGIRQNVKRNLLSRRRKNTISKV